MNIYTMNGIDYLHVQDFARIIGRSKQSTRRLIEDGNSARRLKATRDRSRLMVPVIELVGYPFVNQGKQLTGKDTYHYHAYALAHCTGYDEGESVPIEEAIKLCDEADKKYEDWPIEWRRELCVACTYEQGCMAAMTAEALNVPKGDK